MNTRITCRVLEIKNEPYGHSKLLAKSSMGLLRPERILSAGVVVVVVEGGRRAVEWPRSAAILHHFCSHINKIDVRPRWKRKRRESSLQPKRTWELNNADGHYRRRWRNGYLYRGGVFSFFFKGPCLDGKSMQRPELFYIRCLYMTRTKRSAQNPIMTQFHLTGNRAQVLHPASMGNMSF